MNAAAEVVLKVKLLHTNPGAKAQEVTKELEAFQKHQQATEVACQLLEAESLASAFGIELSAAAESAVLYFAANTVVLRVRSAFIGQTLSLSASGSAAEHVGQVGQPNLAGDPTVLAAGFGPRLLRIAARQAGRAAVCRQVLVASIDSVLSAGLLSGSVAGAVGNPNTRGVQETLRASVRELFAVCQAELPREALLLFLTLLPDEVMSNKVIVKQLFRARWLDALAKELSAPVLSALQGASSITAESLEAAQRWIKLQRFTAEVRRQRRSAILYTCPLLGGLCASPMFRQICAAFCSPGASVAAAQLCGNVLSECIMLTNSPTLCASAPALLAGSGEENNLEFVFIICQAVESLGSALAQAVPCGTDAFIMEKSAHDWDLIQRSRLVCRLLSELSGNHFFHLVALVAYSSQARSGGADNAAFAYSGDAASGSRRGSRARGGRVLARETRDCGGLLFALDENRERQIKQLLDSLVNVALHFVQVKSLEVASAALDFWYNLLSAFMGANSGDEDEDDLFPAVHPLAGTRGLRAREADAFDDEELGEGRRRDGSSKDFIEAMQDLAAGPLEEYFRRLLPALLASFSYPANADSVREEDEVETLFSPDLVSFRDTCANILGDLCAIVPAKWIIDQVGDSLTALCVTDAGGRVDAPWQKIEACIHVLTAVAPKAPAGGDKVIPSMLELLPNLNFPPADQFSGLILRAAAGRLILYTAGFVAGNTDTFLSLMSFLCDGQSGLLASLAAANAAGMSSKHRELSVLAQSMGSEAVKNIANSGRMHLVPSPRSLQLEEARARAPTPPSGEGGVTFGLLPAVPAKKTRRALTQQEWRGLVDILTNLILCESLSLECRTNLVEALGLFISAQEDWQAVRELLGALVLKTGAAAAALVEEVKRHHASGLKLNVSATAKCPDAAAVFFASLSCVGVLRQGGEGGDSDSENSFHDDMDAEGATGGTETDPNFHPVLAVLEVNWPLVEAVCLTVGTAYADAARVISEAFVHIFAYARHYAAESAVFLPVLRTAARCFQLAPCSHWMAQAHAFMSMFGELTRAHTALVAVLIDLSKAFVEHSQLLLRRNLALNALTFDESRMIAETFEVLSELLRFVDLVSIVVPTGWLAPGLSISLSCLLTAQVDAQTLPAVVAILRFLERVATWVDPPPIIHAAADTERVAKATSQLVRTLMQSPFLQTDEAASSVAALGIGAGDQLRYMVFALACLWVGKVDPEGPSRGALPTLASSLRLLLASSLGARTAENFAEAAGRMREWSVLTPERRAKLLRDLDALKSESRNFGRVVGEASSEFLAARRVLQFS